MVYCMECKEVPREYQDFYCKECRARFTRIKKLTIRVNTKPPVHKKDPTAPPRPRRGGPKPKEK